MADEAFQNAVQSYYEVFLKSDRVLKIVQSGACSQHDFREVFRNNIEKRVRSVDFRYFIVFIVCHVCVWGGE